MNTTVIALTEDRTLPDRLQYPLRALSEAERKVASFILNNQLGTLTASAADIAAAAGTSDATVIRTVRALGFTGLAELRAALTDALAIPPTPAGNFRRTISETGPSVDRAIRIALHATKDAVQALEASAGLLREAVQLLLPADRIVLFGMGPTAAIAYYAAAVLARNGRPTQVLDAAGQALADQLLALRPSDALIMLAFGTPYREAIVTLDEAGRLSLPSVLITDQPAGRLVGLAQLTIPVRRGDTAPAALLGGAFAALEAIVLGITVADPATATAALGNLDRLRGALVRGPTAPRRSPR